MIVKETLISLITLGIGLYLLHLWARQSELEYRIHILEKQEWQRKQQDKENNDTP